MSPLPNHTAILVFSRTASAEARAKNFFAVKSIKRNTQLTSHLYRHSVRTAKQSNLPFFICTEKEQRGNTFGERLSNAVEAVFTKGFERVIIIGNDCPSLKAADLIVAATLLNQTSLVLSPTAKGGVSLIGLSKKGFVKDAFATIAWQTNKVAAELQAFAAQNRLSATVLSGKDDINNLIDLTKLLAKMPKLHALFFIVTSLLASLCNYLQSKSSVVFSVTAFRFFGLRAPPCC